MQPEVGRLPDNCGVRRRDPTHYAERNGRAFPSERLRRIIDGRDVAAHGDRTMPVWGDVFRRELGLGGDSAASRIEALVRVPAINPGAGRRLDATLLAHSINS